MGFVRALRDDASAPARSVRRQTFTRCSELAEMISIFRAPYLDTSGGLW